MNQEISTSKTNFEIAQACGADFYPSVEESLVTFTTDELDNFASRICTDKDAKIARLEALVAMKTQQAKRLVWLHQQLRSSKLHIEYIREFQKEANGLEFVIESDTQSHDNAKVLYASAETVAEWRAKETEPLHREVAMLRDAIDAERGCYTQTAPMPKTCSALSNTQATAEAYERDVKAKVWDEASGVWNLCACCWTQEQQDAVEEISLECTKKAAELRAKGE